MVDKNQFNQMMDTLSERLNTNPEELKNNVQNGKLNKILNKMSSADAKKIQNILNDKEASEKILNSPQAQALIKKLMS